MREPFGYIVGRVPVMDMGLEVVPGVMVPRPETELVVETALGALAALEASSGKAADICTGCGAIALALARFGGVSVIGTDASAEALAIAGRNVRKYDSCGRVKLMRGSLC